VPGDTVFNIFSFLNSIKTDQMGDIGFTEILLILVVVVFLFGGKKIPELMKGIGQGMKEFKKASKLDDEPEKEEVPAKKE
jgi:sec-independent protein translocase protein TatA